MDALGAVPGRATAARATRDRPGGGADPRRRAGRDLPAGHGAGRHLDAGSGAARARDGRSARARSGSSARGRRCRAGRIGFPKIRIVVGEPIPVEQAKPTVAAARELTADAAGARRRSAAEPRRPYPVTDATRTIYGLRLRWSRRSGPPTRPSAARTCAGSPCSSARTARRLAGVLGLIVFSSALGSIPAFLIKEVFDTALPDGDLRLLNLLVAGDDRDRDRHRRARRRPDAALEPGRPARDARPAHVRLQAPAAALARVLHAHAHGRGAVAARERHRRRPAGRHLDRDLDRLERDRPCWRRWSRCSCSTGG